MLFNEGFQIGHYEIVNKKIIGKGSFSWVYQGKDQQNDETVAIKVINMDEITNIMHRLKYEIDVMKTLDHVNVIRLKDVIYQENLVFLVLNYCKNGDLHKFLNGRPLKEKYAGFYLRQMASGLQYLYDRSIIHRDLKPQNLLLDDHYKLKITDFGFAKYFDQSGMSETICGTPLYMAPEIMKFNKYSIKSDLWSVGVILYEMVVGRTPYKARNHMELLQKINTQGVIIPISLEISANCRSIIHGLMQKNPKDRMNWNQFFNHPWLFEDMQVSIMGMNSDHRIINENRQFNSSAVNVSQSPGLSCSVNEIFKSPFPTIKKSPVQKLPIIKIIDDYDEKSAKEAMKKCNMNSNTNQSPNNRTTIHNNLQFSGINDCTNEAFFSCDENSESGSESESISFSDGDEDVILGQDKPKSKPITIVIPPKPIQQMNVRTNTIQPNVYENDIYNYSRYGHHRDIGVRYERGRVLPNSLPKNDRQDLFLPVVNQTPKKENGFVVVQSPKEYDIISDILSNENRHLSESLIDYMGDTFNYLRSFIKKR